MSVALTSYSETAAANQRLCLQHHCGFHFRRVADIAGGGIKRANQLEDANTEGRSHRYRCTLTLYFFGELADGFGLSREVHCLSTDGAPECETCPRRQPAVRGTTHPALSPLCEVVSHPDRAGAERVVGERRKVFPFFQTVDHAALQILEREHRRLVVNELAHKQIAEVVDAVFALELLQIEQRTAPASASSMVTICRH